MLSFRNNRNGTLFVEASQPESVLPVCSPGTIGTTLDEQDLLTLLAAVREDEPSSAVVPHLVGGR